MVRICIYCQFQIMSGGGGESPRQSRPASPDNGGEEESQQSYLGQPASGAASCDVAQFEQENCCVPQQPPDNLELLSLSPLRVSLPSPPPSPKPPTVTESSPRLSTQDPNWQSNKTSVRERNSAMFNNSLMADINFVVGPPPSPRRPRARVPQRES